MHTSAPYSSQSVILSRHGSLLTSSVEGGGVVVVVVVVVVEVVAGVLIESCSFQSETFLN